MDMSVSLDVYHNLFLKKCRSFKPAIVSYQFVNDMRGVQPYFYNKYILLDYRTL